MDNYVDFINEIVEGYSILQDKVLKDFRLSLQSVVLYTLLYRRCQLSAHKFMESGKDYTFEFWDNHRNTVFCVYTTKELEPLLRCTRRSITKYINELKEYGYIEVDKDTDISNANRYFLKLGNKKETSKWS